MGVPEIFLEWERQVNNLIRLPQNKVLKRQPRKLLDKYTLEEKKSAIQNGHELMDRMRAMLDTFKRSEQQRQMHEIMLRCIACQVYGDAIWEHELEILEYNNFNNLDKEIMITAPRRFGKSWGVAMFASVVVQCVKGTEISIFSSGKRASGGDTGMMSIVRKFLVGHFQIPETRFSKDNHEHIFIEYGPNDIRKINAYPGSVHRDSINTQEFFVLFVDLPHDRLPVPGP